MLEHTTLVANLLFFLRRIVLEGFSRTQNNLEILADDFKLGRWQKDLLGCCDQLVNPAASRSSQMLILRIKAAKSSFRLLGGLSMKRSVSTRGRPVRCRLCFAGRMVAQRLHYHNDPHGDLDDHRYGLVEGDRHVLIV